MTRIYVYSNEGPVDCHGDPTKAIEAIERSSIEECEAEFDTCYDINDYSWSTCPPVS